MTFDEYIQRRPLFTDFASTIAKVIEAAVAARPEIPRPLVIQHRAKDEAKLKHKLNQRGILESDDIELLIKDLAGCRLVFYTNPAVDGFLRSQIVFDNFDVQTDETKFHHPVPNGPGADTNYRAIHYIVSLTKERLALPEYARFANMRCEIQIQTLLNHAWAETSHDIIYKNPFPPGFGTRQLDAIKRRMDTIMTEYLVPVGYEFQKIQIDVERLKQGKYLLQRGPFEQLEKAADNNGRVELLDHLRDDVVPFYDDITAIYPELRRALLQAIHAGRETTPKPIETAFGELKGKTASDVTESAVDIFDYLRYLDIQATFASYCEVFPGVTGEEEKKRILDAVGHLAENNIKVWRQAGSYVQSELLNAIAAFDADKRNLLRPIVLAVCQHALSPEVTGTSSPSFDTISFHRGSVRVSDVLKHVRSMVLTVLENLYQEAETEEEKYAAFNVMLDATRHPYQGQYSDELIALTLQNTQRVVDFCARHRQPMSYELLQHVEHHLLWFYQNVPSWILADRPGMAEEIDQLRQAIARFRDDANADVGFVRHKTLVGFKAVFPPDWDAVGRDSRCTRAYRTARVAEFIDEINDQIGAEWLEVIKRCAATQSSDMATFPTFIGFLTRLAKARPEVVSGYLADIPEDLSRFLPAILEGLEQTEQASAAKALMQGWISEGRYLLPIGRHLRLAAASHPNLIRSLADRAAEAGDVAAIVEAVAVIVARSEFVRTPIVDEVFVPCLRILTERGDMRWVDEAWFQTTALTFFSSLNESQAQAVLDNMVHHRRVDHHMEVILAALAGVAYDLVWQFFGKRLKHQAADDSGYDAIPFKFFHATTALGANADHAVSIVKTWYVDDDPMFQFTGGRLIAIAFPDFPNMLRDKLHALIATDGEKALGFVWSILDHYKGIPATHSVCQALIEAIPEDDQRLDQIEMLLMGTDVVHGPFGFVEAYQQKKAELQCWLNDPRPKIAAFAARCIRNLDRRIAAEQSASEERLRLRQLEWQHEAAE